MNMLEVIRDMFFGRAKCPECPNIGYLTERIETLSHELSLCVGPIDIIEQHKTIISPYDVIYGYDTVVADQVYLTYTIEDWTAIVSRLHRQLGGKYEWTKEVYDCDDIALLYASTLAYSAYRAGLSKQPAFAIAWSRTHAFNLLIDNDNGAWLIEPQTGTILGRLGEDNGDTYDVKKIWFIG